MNLYKLCSILVTVYWNDLNQIVSTRSKWRSPKRCKEKGKVSSSSSAVSSLRTCRSSVWPFRPRKKISPKKSFSKWLRCSQSRWTSFRITQSCAKSSDPEARTFSSSCPVSSVLFATFEVDSLCSSDGKFWRIKNCSTAPSGSTGRTANLRAIWKPEKRRDSAIFSSLLISPSDSNDIQKMKIQNAFKKQTKKQTLQLGHFNDSLGSSGILEDFSTFFIVFFSGFQRIFSTF